MAELSETTQRISGTDFGLRDPAWLTRFGNATRVAATYRKGRVLLAGDAAHMHFPAGGVGLNLGLQDAMNLGWKLAAVVQARADVTLLDTYHDERRPWAVDVAEHTLAQTALITATTPTGQALRRLLSDLIGRLPDLFPDPGPAPGRPPWASASTRDRHPEPTTNRRAHARPAGGLRPALARALCGARSSSRSAGGLDAEHALRAHQLMA
jgi:2-polyprenyl-6-methoxyphenol hydroxylase-like FAD-dependent oxidoreductase